MYLKYDFFNLITGAFPNLTFESLLMLAGRALSIYLLPAPIRSVRPARVNAPLLKLE
jgi:hypothetical protein